MQRVGCESARTHTCACACKKHSETCVPCACLQHFFMHAICDRTFAPKWPEIAIFCQFLTYSTILELWKKNHWRMSNNRVQIYYMFDKILRFFFHITKGASAGAKCDHHKMKVRARVRAHLHLDVRVACVRCIKPSQPTLWKNVTNCLLFLTVVYDYRHHSISMYWYFNYRTRTIITRGLYTFYPIFEGQKRLLKELFS